MSSRSARQQPFTIYTDLTASRPVYQAEYYEPRMSASPSPYDADNGLSSDENDSVLPSIESPNKARRSSAAFTNVSSIPPSLPYNSDIPPYTPHKGPRPAFRSPSSVRAMQMSSPPPFQGARGTRMGSPLNGRRARGGTPSSIRSGSVLHNVHHAQDYDETSSMSHGNQSGRNTPSTQQPQTSSRGPLVLLHVTVLPGPALPYSAESLRELAPSYVLQNCYLLQEKLTETVLTRGVLIPHPGEEFDLLEEGLLETLGLCAPRIGSCGHFYGEVHESDDSDSGNDSGVSDVGGGHKELRALCERPHSWSTQSDLEDLCSDCDQSIRLPGKGIGSGNSRWDLKIYAANGLMRAGAWSAAYREMERVDVEIEPWIPEDVRRALDLRLEHEQDELRKEREELERLRFDLEVMERLRTEADDERSRAEQRARELEQDLELAKTAPPPPALPLIVGPSIDEELIVPKTRESLDTSHEHTAIPTPSEPTSQEIPLSTLLRNYLILLAQDRRNVAVGILSVLVIFLSLRLATPPQATAIRPLTDTMPPQFGSGILRDSQFEAVPRSAVVEDTDVLTRSAASNSPIASAIRPLMEMAEAHDSEPKPPVSQPAAEFVPVESPPSTREGSATAPHASAPTQAGEPSGRGGRV